MARRKRNDGVADMVTQSRLLEKQREMRRRMASRPRTGRPMGGKTKRDLVSMSELRFLLHGLLTTGHGVDAAVHAVNKKFGARLVADAVRQWRATAYTQSPKSF